MKSLTSCKIDWWKGSLKLHLSIKKFIDEEINFIIKTGLLYQLFHNFLKPRSKQGKVNTYRLIKPSLIARLNVSYLYYFIFYKNIFDNMLSDYLLRQLYQYIESLEQPRVIVLFSVCSFVWFCGNKMIQWRWLRWIRCSKGAFSIDNSIRSNF